MISYKHKKIGIKKAQLSFLNLIDCVLKLKAPFQMSWKLILSEILFNILSLYGTQVISIQYRFLKEIEVGNCLLPKD